MDELKRTPAYEVWQRDQTVYVAYDRKTGITRYAVFEDYRSADDKLVVAPIPAETTAMHVAERKKTVHLSVCDPSLNIMEKIYMTKGPSHPIHEVIELEDRWGFLETPVNVRLEYEGAHTILDVACQHG